MSDNTKENHLKNFKIIKHSYSPNPQVQTQATRADIKNKMQNKIQLEKEKK